MSLCKILYPLLIVLVQSKEEEAGIDQESIREQSGSMVECLTRGREAAGSSLNALCPWARHINPSLALVQPRKTRPCIAERLLMGHKESNQTKNNTIKYHTWPKTPHGNVIKTWTWECDKNTRKHHLQESQEASPCPAGDHKATMNRQDSMINMKQPKTNPDMTEKLLTGM